MVELEALKNILQCRGREPTSRKITICDTVIETNYIVLPRHANPLGRVHGGQVIEWILDTAALSGVKISRGPVVVASMDYMFFLNPVEVGDLFIVKSWIPFIGNTSLEVGILAYTYSRRRVRITTFAHLALVAVNDNLRPRPVPVKIRVEEEWEKELARRAVESRERRKPLIEGRRKAVSNLDPPEPLDRQYVLRSYKIAMPEDMVYAHALHAGRLLYWLDEVAGVLASSYARGIVVTASVDATAFYHPIMPGDVIEMVAAITYTGRKTVEVAIKTITENMLTRERKHTTTAYFTMVHIDLDGKTKELPPQPSSINRQVLLEGEERRSRRNRILSELRRVKPILEREVEKMYQRT